MQPLPGNVVRLTRSHQGLELHFPPLRNPGAALMLALFGISCLIPGLFAGIAVAPLSEYGPGGMIAIWLMSIFILPFIAFGLLFVALALYQVANSLTVNVSVAEIRSQRRIFGVALRERRVLTADIAALDPLTALRYRWPREEISYYNLVAKTKSGAGLTLMEAHRTGRLALLRNRKITVAESLRGEALMEQIKAEIIRAARLERLATKK
jgi:hypothetical protein